MIASGRRQFTAAIGAVSECANPPALTCKHAAPRNLETVGLGLTVYPVSMGAESIRGISGLT